jgi:alkylated DNA repair dioxygenase AlkB
MTSNISGLVITPEFITPNEEKELIAKIDAQPWNKELSRQTQHYGFRYVYSTRQLSPASPIPEWLNDLNTRICNHLNLTKPFNQVIINEYYPGQGISAHTDHSILFGPVVVSVSLQSGTVMEFIDKTKTELYILPRTLLAMTGDARYKYRHAIPSRITDTVNNQVIQRERRVSITFRTTNNGLPNN